MRFFLTHGKLMAVNIVQYIRVSENDGRHWHGNSRRNMISPIGLNGMHDLISLVLNRDFSWHECNRYLSCNVMFVNESNLLGQQSHNQFTMTSFRVVRYLLSCTSCALNSSNCFISATRGLSHNRVPNFHGLSSFSLPRLPFGGYPQLIHFSRIIHRKLSIWGTTILGNRHSIFSHTNSVNSIDCQLTSWSAQDRAWWGASRGKWDYMKWLKDRY
jgi:hypothetical protein